MKSLYIYGASGHGLVVADIAKSCGYNKIIFIDDGDNDFMSFDEIKTKNKTPLVFGIGSNKIRKRLYEKVKMYDFELVNLIHPSAIVSESVTIDFGVVIMPNVVVNANTKIGKCVILNSSSVVEHENIIEDFVHISPCVSIAGNVKVKCNTHIGIGSSIIQNIRVGKNCIIGAGSIVINNVDDNKLAYGNPCKTIKELSE